MQNELFFLDLRRSSVELYGRLSTLRKRQIKRWDARSGWLCADRERLFKFIIATAPAFFASRGASDTYAFSGETWQSLASAPNVCVLGALENGKLVAAMLFAYAGSNAEI